MPNASVAFRTTHSLSSNVPPYLQGKEFEELCVKGLDQAFEKSYEHLSIAHVTDYKSYYDRVELDIGKSEGTPQLAEACKNSLNLRGDEGTGWSLGWKIGRFWY